MKETRSRHTLFAFVQFVWEELRVGRAPNYVDIDVVRIQSWQNMTMELLVNSESHVIL